MFEGALPQQHPLDDDSSAHHDDHDHDHDHASPAVEPLACVSCRARKLKCDRTKPACARCLKIKNTCVYPESRRKPTLKRKNVKDLEARLAQMEQFLSQVGKTTEGSGLHLDEDDLELPNGDGMFHSDEADLGPQIPLDMPNFTSQDQGIGEDDMLDAGMSGELMPLGMFESLPPFQVMEELNDSFFQTYYHHLPIVHQGRYLQAFYGPPNKKPPMCLQYAIWLGAACEHAKYSHLADVFYKRTRQYLQADELKGDGEHFITLAHAQAWAIVATYEAKSLVFTKASMSCARYVRLTQVLGLDTIDKENDYIAPTLRPARSWVELEERRRVFWGAFAIDAHANINCGMASLIRTDEVITRLPASEEAFASGQQEDTAYLEDIFKGAPFSGFSRAVITCYLFKAVLQHIHRAKPSDKAQDLVHGEFWKRHRDIDNKLLNVFMFLPDEMRFPQNSRDPSAVHMNLNLHATVICLHHAALEMIDKHHLPDSTRQNSISRLKAAGEEIVHIIQMTSHNLSVYKSQLCALSFYCATTVYIYLAKADPDHGLSPMDISNLEIIISAMEAVGRAHTITCAYLQQACLDIERNGLSSCIRLPSLAQYRNIFGGPTSNIPLVARSAVTRHTEAETILPGRLPLGQPKGNLGPKDFGLYKQLPSMTGVVVPDEGSVHGEAAAEPTSFKPAPHAETQNMQFASMAGESGGSKRRRVTSSPGLQNGPPNGSRFWQPVSPSSLSSIEAVHAWRSGGHNRAHTVESAPSVPDRSNSSVSSPAQRDTPIETVSSRSNHASPPNLGIGGHHQEEEKNRMTNSDREAQQILRGMRDPSWGKLEGGIFYHLTEICSQFPGDASGNGDDAWTMMEKNAS